MSNLAKRLQSNQERTIKTKTTTVVKKSRLTFGEKILGIIFCIALFVAATKIVTYQASIYEVNKEIQQLNTEIAEKEKVNNELANQVSELSTYERIWAKAVELGLMLNENNVKVVQD